MKEKYTKTNYPSKNLKSETYEENGTFITKHYYDDKSAYVKELTNLKDEIKEVKHFTVKGVLSKLEYFLRGKRHGIETKYFIPKANQSVKSTKTYNEGKLHGECITYNSNDEIIKQEVYADGKLILKYLRNNSNNNDIANIQIIDKDNVDNLPKAELEKLQDNIEKNPNWLIG
jgi:antitoxin component YwqK of YwqJK toxin-antitoxin module